MDAISVSVVTLAWFQVLGFLQISHSKLPLVPKYQLLGMLRKVWMLLVQSSWQLRHQDLWKGCCHSAYWLIWTICWHCWLKLFCITYSLPLACFLWFKKPPTPTKQEKSRLTDTFCWCPALSGGVSCGRCGKQEEMGTSCARIAPNHWVIWSQSSVFSWGLSCRGSFSI